MDVKSKNADRVRKVKQIKEPVEVVEKTVTPGLEKVEIKKPRTPSIKAPRQK
ncbi:MAG: hypothetical protein ACXWW4_12630 [Candidatus Binatia bacterium]